MQAWRLARALAQAGEEVTLLATDDDPCLQPGTVRERLDGPVRVCEVAHPRTARVPGDTLGREDVLRAVEGVVAGWRPEVAHLHHLMYLGLDLPRRLAAAGVPVVLTLHEYWLLCPRNGQLLHPGGGLCEGPEEGLCARCLRGFRFGRGPRELRVARWAARVRGLTSWDPFPLLKRLASRGGRKGLGPRELPRDADPALVPFLRRRREAVAGLRPHVAGVLAPSRFLAARFEACGWPSGSIRYWPNGVPVEPGSRRFRGDPDRPLKVGYMGAVSPQKGLHVLVEAHARMARGQARLRIHGDLRFDPAYWARTRQRLVREEVELAGPFDPGEAPAVLREMDVLVVPSVWYENAPLVIAEAHAAGVPVVASRLGGMAEMIQDGRDGALFRPGDAGELARVLGRLASDRRELERLAARCRPHRTLDEEIRDLKDLYRALTGAHA